MSLLIKIEDGQPVGHPAYEENLIQAFGAVPDGWEPFVRPDAPAPGIYEVVEGHAPAYEKVDGVWSDVWLLRPMTAEDRLAKQQLVIDAFNSREYFENWSAWTMDEATCTMQPPIPRPPRNEEKIQAGIYTYWCGAENGWKDAPAYPSDGNKYKFDFIAWQWVMVTP